MSSEQESARGRAAILGVTGIDFRVIDLREIAEHRGGLGLFEQIICLETIEHVSDDERLVKELAGMLAPGGRLLLSTPFEHHRPLFTEDPQPSVTEDGSHVRYGYSQERLRQIVTDAGLRIDSENFISGVVSQKLTNLMRRLSTRVGLFGAWTLVLPLRALVMLDAPLSKAMRYPYLSVALCAVKNASPSSL